MYIMVYQKVEEEGQPPIRKWVLEIKPTPDGMGFVIHSAPNTYQADTKKKIAETQQAAAEKTAAPPQHGEAIGKFTSQVLLKKSKKKGPMIPKIKPLDET
jgi:hypothetical protein